MVGARSMDESNSVIAYTFSSAGDPGQIFTKDSDHQVKQHSQVDGEDYAKAIHTRWGTVDYEDLMAWAELESCWAQSPIAHIGQAKTPTLIIHSEQDMRCDPEQGVQVFVALKPLGVDTEWGSFRKNPMDFHGAAAQIGESYD